MKKLSKTDVARLSDYDVRLLAAAGAVEAFCINQLKEAVDQYNELIGAYNEVLNEAKGFLEDLVSEGESYRDDKSERWQESDAGLEHANWIDEIEQFGSDLEELELLEEIEVPEFADSLEDNVPGEPS